MNIPEWKQRKLRRTEYMLLIARQDSEERRENVAPVAPAAPSCSSDPALAMNIDRQGDTELFILQTPTAQTAPSCSDGPALGMNIDRKDNTDLFSLQTPMTQRAPSCSDGPALAINFNQEDFTDVFTLQTPPTHTAPSCSDGQALGMNIDREDSTHLFTLQTPTPQTEQTSSNQERFYIDSTSDGDFSRGSDEVYIPESSTDEISNSPSPLPSRQREVEINIQQSITLGSFQNEQPNETKIKSRKRVSKPETWGKNVRKIQRNTGQAYINSSGKQIPNRQVKGQCNNKCRVKCPTKITQEQQQQINKSYWKLGDVNRQRDYLIRCMQPIAPKYELKKRTCNYAYYLEINNEVIRVCKTFFVNTLNINKGVVSTALKKKNSEGFVEKDKRGGDPKSGRPRIEADIKNYVRRHIESFPVMESHYCRARSERKYLHGDINLTEMYRQYVKKCTDNNVKCVKKHLYETIFNTEYNISFYTPKKDACSFCTNYSNLSGDEKLKKLAEYENHIKEKNQSRLEKEADIENANDNTLVSCFDLQAVQPIPEGNTSDFFYKRRLSNYNFTIFDAINKEGYCYTWHEAVARRGVIEIGSCVLKYLHSTGKKNYIFYSDNCPGQNKNKFIVALYLYAVQVLEIDSIEHKFFIVGHTQNEGDSMHALIEREKKRALKGGPLFVPTQLVPIMALAKKSGKPYSVTEMSYYDFRDIKSLVSNGDNFTKNQHGETVKWNNIHIVKVEKSSPTVIKYKNSFFDEEFKSITIRRQTRARQGNAELNSAYTRPPGISAVKKKDLLALCKTGAITRVYWEFYENLPTAELALDPAHDSD